MKTPAFWNSKNWLSTLLLPLAAIYDMIGTLYRANVRPVTLPIPVICIGNVTAGGSGKTPVALYIGERLKAKNIPAFFLSRGYSGQLKGPVLVDAQKHTAHDVGDEPLLLAAVLPTIVAQDRLAGAQLALQKGAKAIIMDDGFQNPFLTKSLSLLVIDGRIGLGNERVIPAGPLREQPRMAYNRAHGFVLINRSTRIPKLPDDKPVLIATTQTKDAHLYKGKKLFAFCGIAYPQKFYDSLNSTGAQLVETVSFPDHYAYTTADIDRLIARAAKYKAPLVTTSKDAVRIPPEVRDCVAVVDMMLEFDSPHILDNILDYILDLNEKN